jgi:hypothetical protein
VSRALRAERGHLNPEKVAYWYFRLNGFHQIENFVVHPGGRGGQRTDADLIGVRFPFRAERLFDNLDDIMDDDSATLALTDKIIDIILVEVKTNEPCKLNGPWTREDAQNVHRVIAAVGCLPPNRIEHAASEIYRTGVHISEFCRIRLIAVGRLSSDELSAKFPNVTQLVWSDMLRFIWERFRRYRHQKRQVDQWDADGRKIKQLADETASSEEYIERALRVMGVRTIPIWL